jgi:hypothetical protein
MNRGREEAEHTESPSHHHPRGCDIPVADQRKSLSTPLIQQRPKDLLDERVRPFDPHASLGKVDV